MDAVEMGLGFMADIELRATGITPRMGHRQGSSLMLLGVDLAIDLVTRATGPSHATGPIPTIRATSLSHEAGDDAVKRKPVIEAILGQFDEVGHGVGRVGLEQLELNQACLGVHQGLGHGTRAKLECKYMGPNKGHG